MKKRICVPFDKNGSLVTYAGQLSLEEEEECLRDGILHKNQESWYGGETWKPNFTFETTLHYTGFGRGRSSAGFTFEDEEGHSYWMFMTDMDDMIKGGVAPLCVKGTFGFAKRGQNYGIKLLEE